MARGTSMYNTISTISDRAYFSVYYSGFSGAINGDELIVGTAAASGGLAKAYLWQSGRSTDLGSLGTSRGTYADAINDQGQIVGSSSGLAFLWQYGVMTSLGALHPTDTSWALGINDNGQI